MAHSVEKYKAPRPCPRCGNEEILVSLFHFGATWKAQCAECGLGKESSGDDFTTAKSSLNNEYYKWEELNKQ